VGSVDTPDYALGVAVSGSYAYVADGDSGLHILPTQCEDTSIDDVGIGTSLLPRTFRLSQNYPNPFNPSTTISFDLPLTADNKRPVSITIYDIRGRRVRILIDSDLEHGSHKIHWDGRNDRGQSVASGIYLYTLKAGEEKFTRKMTVLK
jgi:hypothetical protein